MSIYERLSALAPKTQTLDILSGGSGDLTRTEIAGLLSGLDRGPAMLAWHAFADGPRQDAEIALFMALMDEASKRGWDIPKGKEIHRKIADMVLAIYLHPPKCPSCHGRGEDYFSSPPTACSNCKGSGNWPMTTKARAQMLGVSEREYRKKWAERERVCAAILSEWLGEIWRKVAEKLTDFEN